jgi:transposase
LTDAQRIAELEALLAERDAQIAASDALLSASSARIAANEERLKALETKLAAALDRIAELEAKLGMNSSNSSMPPSSDKPWNKPKLRPRIPSGKRRGGQKGHKGHSRELVPPDKLRNVTDVYPEQCDNCGSHDLVPDGSEPVRHQVTDIPRVEPHTDETRLHASACCNCGATTRAKLPTGTPRGNFGPMIVALVALLTGVYRVGKRGVRQLLGDLYGVEMSLGAVSRCEQQVSEATAEPVEGARQWVQDRDEANVDETTWWQEAKKTWLWVATTAYVAVYFILPERSSECAKKVLGRFKGILCTDRYKGYWFYPMGRRQVCWAHLRREFQAMSERGGTTGAIGTELLALTDEMFHRWHQLKDGVLTRRRFRGLMLPLSKRIIWLLDQGMVHDSVLSGKFEDILKHEDALWTFVRVEGVEPTNNAAERDVRHAVLLRRVSHGTQSESGSRFVERMLTVNASLRKQDRNVLDFLLDAVHAKLNHTTPPSLLPSQALADAA